MDPVVAYLLLRNIQKEKEVINKENNISQVSRKETRSIDKIHCSRCGQNTYWCQCPNKKEKEK
jgi:hypothetical protein